MTFGAGMFGALSPTTMRRPTDQSGGLAAMLGGLAQQQPQQMGMATAPQPTAGGRIPVSGGSSPDLSKLFAEADKMAKMSSGGGGEMVNGQFQPSEETMKAYKDFQNYNQLYNTGFTHPASPASIKNRAAETVDLRRQMDLMSISGMPQAEILKNLGHDAQGEAGASAASLAAQKDAEQFLAGLGQGGGSMASASSGGRIPVSSTGGGSSGSLASTSSRTSSPTRTSAPTTGGTSFVDPTLPGRIPVSTGTAATPGSITSKPAGVSNADWKKYQSLSGKIDNRERPISAKNQKWYDNFVAKYGTTTTPPPAGGGGGGGGGGSTSPPTGSPQDYAAGLGLLMRPYDNPFERRNLWNQFPGGP